MSTGLFADKSAEVLRRSADQLEGYIASEETIDRYCELFIRLGRKSLPSNPRRTGGYKAFVLTQIS